MRRFSAKQISMFGALQKKPLDGCPRKWGGYYLDKVRPEGLAEPLVFGIKFHAVCESLVKTGRMPEPHQLQPGIVLTPEDCAPESIYGQMARKAIVHLPEKLVPAWVTEYVGFYVWTTSTGLTVELDLRTDVFHDGPIVDLVDWKSTGQARNALKTLLDDVQANIYAYGLCELLRRDVTLAHWVYVIKSAPHKAWPLRCLFQKNRTEQWLHDNIDATLELMHSFSDAQIDAMALPGDIEACGGVGMRCDFEGRCLGAVGPRPSLISLEEILRYKQPAEAAE